MSKPQYSYSMLVDKNIKPDVQIKEQKSKNPLSVSKDKLPLKPEDSKLFYYAETNLEVPKDATIAISENDNVTDQSKKPTNNIRTPETPRTDKKTEVKITEVKPEIVPVKQKNRSIFNQVAASAASVTSVAASMATDVIEAATIMGLKKPQEMIVSGIETRRVHTWVRDSTIHNCYSCKTPFTMFYRKHHCRLCGRIFCSECTKYRQKIPGFLITYLPKRYYEVPSVSRLITDSGSTLKNIKEAIVAGPNPSSYAFNTSPILPTVSAPTAAPATPGSRSIPNSGIMKPSSQNILGSSPTTTILMGPYMNSEQDQENDSCEKEDEKSEDHDFNGPQRLCKNCFIKLNELTNLRYLIDLFGVPGTTIKDLRNYSLVCKDWLHIASYHLSSFREMQYYLPYHKFSKYDRQMLWDNRFYLVNHGTWLTQLIRSIDYRNDADKSDKSDKRDKSLQDSQTHQLIEMLGIPRMEKIVVKLDPQDHSSADGLTDDPILDFRRQSTRNHGGSGSNLCDIASHSTMPENSANLNATLADKALDNPANPVPVNPVNPVNPVKSPQNFTKTVKKVSCWSLMCTRTCQPNLRPEDAIILLDYHTQSRELRSWAMSQLLKTDLEELRCYLPILVHHMRYESIEQSVIGISLLRLITNGFNSDKHKQKQKGFDELRRSYLLLFTNDLYWQLMVSTESRAYHLIYRYFLDQFCNNLDPDVLNKILRGKHANSLIHATTSNATGVANAQSSKKFSEDQIKQVLEMGIKNTITFPPTNPFLDYELLDVKRVKQSNSNSRPLILPFSIKTLMGTSLDKYILYKNEDLRKDKIVMNLIKLASMILKKEEDLDLGLITYEICPTTSSTGFLEMVPKSKTLYDIKEKLEQSINSFIDSHNDDIPVSVLRSRFNKSCAGYCVITYLLGIGDRHLDNIMITEDGYIFHIDYGFILGADPKPMTKPKMRLTDDMVEAMGGTESKYYLEFKEISNRVYNCLRRHVGLFISMLDLLTDADPVIENRVPITRELLMKEIYKRFVPGETYSEAQVLLETEIDNSNQTYTHAINDFFHHHAKEKTLKKAFGSTFKSIKGFFG